MQNYYHIYNSLLKLTLVIFTLLLFLLANVLAQTPGAGNALNFDGYSGGVGEYVTMGENSNLQITGDMTFEAWVYIPAAPATDSSFSVVACGESGETAATNHLYGFEIDDGLVLQYFHENANGQNVNLNAVMEMWTGQWVHLTFSRYYTIEPVVLFTYDGMREGEKGFINYPNGGGSSVFILGGGFKDILAAPISTKFFDGVMDEVRVWDTAVSFWHIREWMNRRVTPDHPNYPNLVAYWKLDEALDSPTAIDSMGEDDNGTLTNMELGGGGDRILSTAPIGDASIFAVRSDLTDPETFANITGTPQVPIDVIFGTGDEDPGFFHPLAAIQVNAAPNTPPDPKDYSSPNTYWVLWSRDGQFDGDFTATVRFHYDYIGGIINENTLNLLTRSDPNGAWGNITATLVTDPENGGEGYFEITITESDGFSGQYIIVDPTKENPLPVELATFTAHLVDEGVKLEWVTYGEVNNLGFELWRAIDNDEKYQMISSYQNNRRLIGAGNSNTTHYYQYLDKNVREGHDYYYQLWDVSYSGERNSYGPISLSINSADNFPENYTLYQNYPNPFNPLTYIRFQIHQMNFHGDKLVPVNLDIYDLLGKKIKSLMNSDLHIGDYTYSWDGTNDMGHRVASGTYVYTLRLGNHIVSRKLVLIR